MSLDFFQTGVAALVADYSGFANAVVAAVVGVSGDPDIRAEIENQVLKVAGEGGRVHGRNAVELRLCPANTFDPNTDITGKHDDIACNRNVARTHLHMNIGQRLNLHFISNLKESHAIRFIVLCQFRPRESSTHCQVFPANRQISNVSLLERIIDLRRASAIVSGVCEEVRRGMIQ